MKCSKCGYENRETAQFCQRCGAALPVDSPSNKPGSRRRGRKETQPIEPQPPSQPATAPANSTSDTHPLVKASIAFAPLPEGALLHDGQYVVSELYSSNEQLNVYAVESFEPARVCANCQTETFDLDDQFCSSCGADISNIAPLHLHYRVQESADGHAFASQAQLLEMQLTHPGLSLPHHAFVESPYGPPRHYLWRHPFRYPNHSAECWNGAFLWPKPWITYTDTRSHCARPI
jgi:hypothetical protein